MGCGSGSPCEVCGETTYNYEYHDCKEKNVKKALTPLEQKQREYDRVRLELMEMRESEKNNVTIPRLRKLVGTYWKYRSCYSCPGPNDYWWLYAYVADLNEEDATLTLHEFQVDKDGRLDVRPNTTHSGEHFPDSGWVKCGKLEFRLATIKAGMIMRLMSDCAL